MRRDHSTVQTASDILNRQLLLLLPHIRDIDELKSLVAIKEAVQHCLSLVSSESRIVIYKLAINPLNPQLNSVNYSDLTKLCGKIKIDSSLLISISDSTYIMASILNGNNVKEHTELLYRELSYLMAKNPCKVQISFTQTTLRDLTSSEHFLKSLENSLKVFMDILNDNSLMGWLGAIYQQEVYDHQFVLPCSVSI